MTEIDRTTTHPGIHRLFQMSRFGDRERRLIERLASQWYLTSSGALSMAASRYDYFLMKPTPMFTEMFNIERELIVVLSPYKRFEPRTLDAFDAAQRKLSDLRVESVCRVLISDDPDVERKVTDLLKTDPEQPVVIPFTFDELSTSYDDFFLRNRFRRHFYTRDLFAFLSPLRRDLYFFGRSQLLQEIINKHRSGEHTGLFGLRKSGKTSIIYAIERHLHVHGREFLSIDCESPSVHGLRWFELLQKLVREYKSVRGSKFRIAPGPRYTETTAADSFTADVLAIYRSKDNAPLMILFDEVERLSPATGSSRHWRDGSDFVLFWQTLRGFYQRHQEVFTYMLVGTNPSCVEQSTIAGHENPLFGSIPNEYVPSFTVGQTREMVRKLGRYMGLHFDEMLYAKLVEDFGGHPFLIRQFCSEIHKACIGDRPARVDKALYGTVMTTFRRTAIDYLSMIVSVLRDWYPDEYEMLRLLAHGDQDTFSTFALDHAAYTRHLIGYGLIAQSVHGYTFNIEFLREYINDLHKYERLNLSDDEKVAEISARRNRIERLLRIALGHALRVAHGRKKAGESVREALPEKRRESVGTSDIDVLLSRDRSPLYFRELIAVVKREWSTLQNVFELEKGKLELMLEEVNASGRPDAHAKYLSDDEFAQLRLYLKKLETILDAWNQ